MCLGGIYLYHQGLSKELADRLLNLKWSINRKISEKIQSPVSLISTIDAFPNLSFDRPISLEFARDGSNAVYVAETKGTVVRFENKASVARTTVVLDLSDKIGLDPNAGLYGFTFDPKDKIGKTIYVVYNELKQGINYWKVSKFQLDRSTTLSPLRYKESVLLQAKTKWHQGGTVAFGKDGYLYVSIGDGFDKDPKNNAQNLAVLNGKILRIDVNSGDKSGYTIPKDNPFYHNREGYRQEIYAYGFRNPFRFSIDSLTNQFWLGDVGQEKFEEINRVEKGGNYGWKVREGKEYYDSAQNHNAKALIPPIFSYAHGIEGFSITGGLIYRGRAIPRLYGKYVYGDYVRAVLWALDFKNERVVSNDLIASRAGNVVHFGEDLLHEIYYCDYVKGEVRKIVPAPNALLRSKVGYGN